VGCSPIKAVRELGELKGEPLTGVILYAKLAYNGGALPGKAEGNTVGS